MGGVPVVPVILLELVFSSVVSDLTISDQHGTPRAPIWTGPLSPEKAGREQEGKKLAKKSEQKSV